MEGMPQLDTVLDRIVDDLRHENPEMSEFEAAFSAIRLNLTILTQTLATIGMDRNGLSDEVLYGICHGLVQTCQWMAAKELATMTMREIDKDAE